MLTWLIICIFATSLTVAAQENLPTSVERTVELDVAVSRRGNFLTDLPADAFSVLETGTPQTIRAVIPPARPISVCLLMDDSGSAREQTGSAEDVAIALLRVLDPKTEVCVIHFRDNVYMSQRLTVNRGHVLEALRRTTGYGPTNLWDACILAAEYLSENGQYRTKRLVLISDGGNNQSTHSLEDAIVRLREYNMSVFGLIFVPRKGQNAVARRDMTKLIESTGGTASFSVGPGPLEKAAAEMAKEFESLYSIIYVPSRQNLDGKFRKLKVKVNDPRGRISVRTRPGYYATEAGFQ